MYLRTLEICVLKYTNLIQQNFFISWISMASSFKKTKLKLNVKKGITGGIYHYLEKLHELHNDLPFLFERMKSERS